MGSTPLDYIPVKEAKQILEKALTLMSQCHITRHYMSVATFDNILKEKYRTVDHTIVSRLRHAISDWEQIP